MKKLFLLFVFIGSFFFFNVESQAYIPRIKTIVKKMAKNNGRKIYKIQREVSFQDQENLLKAKETWFVKNGDTMKLVVESVDSLNPWSFIIVYDRNKRKTLSSAKNIKTFSRSEEFFEPLFHDRYHKSLLSRLERLRFVPAWAKNVEDPDYNEGETKMVKEDFVHLEPVLGTVNYAIGSHKNDSGDNKKITLWVEQDSFLIRKGRLRSTAEFTNSKFQTFSGGLKLPTEQTINWKDKVARIRLVRAERISADKKTWKIDKSKSSSLPNEPIIKEFYSRFR